MPIHVKELVVRANVGLPASDSTANSPQAEAIPSQGLVQAVVAEMLRIMKAKKNR